MSIDLALDVQPVSGALGAEIRGFDLEHITDAEFDALLAHLYSFSEQPQFQCRYRWAPGGVGIWDNRCTQHYAVNDYDERRVIQRVTVLGDDPQGSAPRWDHYTPGRMSAAESPYR